jgi:hypothetical protein
LSGFDGDGSGAVLGVDVGFSPTRRSSAACRLDWDSREIAWTIKRFRALPGDRRDTIFEVAGNVTLEVAAFDGPLRSGLDVIGSYRTAERMLTKRLSSQIGKPGQASAPVGKALNAAANECVQAVLDNCWIKPSDHAIRIHDRAIVEAFPSSFLGVMLQDPAVVHAQRGDRSDTFFKHLTQDGTIQRLIEHFLPNRKIRHALETVVNHDDRAALVCALPALAVASGDFTAVGDHDGWIILPPRRFVQPWARSNLTANSREEQPGCLYETLRKA